MLVELLSLEMGFENLQTYSLRFGTALNKATIQLRVNIRKYCSAGGVAAKTSLLLTAVFKVREKTRALVTAEAARMNRAPTLSTKIPRKLQNSIRKTQSATNGCFSRTIPKWRHSVLANDAILTTHCDFILTF